MATVRRQLLSSPKQMALTLVWMAAVPVWRGMYGNFDIYIYIIFFDEIIPSFWDHFSRISHTRSPHTRCVLRSTWCPR